MFVVLILSWFLFELDLVTYLCEIGLFSSDKSIKYCSLILENAWNLDYFILSIILFSILIKANFDLNFIYYLCIKYAIEFILIVSIWLLNFEFITFFSSFIAIYFLLFLISSLFYYFEVICLMFLYG